MALLELPLRRSIAPTGVLRFSLTSPQRWSALTLTMQNSHSTRSAKVGSGQCTGSSEQTLFSLKDKFFSSEYGRSFKSAWLRGLRAWLFSSPLTYLIPFFLYVYTDVVICRMIDMYKLKGTSVCLLHRRVVSYV